METAIFIVWWIGLVLALIPTLAIVKEVLLVLGTLRSIGRLAGVIQRAADGLAGNLAGVGGLGARTGAEHLPRHTASIAAATEGVERKLTALRR